MKKEFPPRTNLYHKNGSSRPFVAVGPLMDAVGHEYLSLEEHEALLAQAVKDARAEAWEEAKDLFWDHINRKLTDKDAPFVWKLIAKAKEEREKK